MPADAPLPTIRIRPAKGWTGLRLGELWEFRDVLFMLAVRDIKLRYKQTMLGIVWVVLQPMLTGAIFAIVFGQFARLPSNGQPYLLFVFAGLLGWNLFAGIVQRGGNSLVTEARLITKVYFPRLLIPCASAAAAMVDFLVSLMVMLLLLFWFRTWPGINLLLLPFMIALTLMLSIGVSLWVSALNVRYRDFTYALPFFIQAWMYASPVVYGSELIPERWRGWFSLNPMTGLINGYRQSLLGTSSDTSGSILMASVIASVVLITGAFVFRRIERDFADSL